MSTKEPCTDHPEDAGFPLTEFVTFRLVNLVNLANRDSARWHQAHTGLSLAEWRLLAGLGHFGPNTGAYLSEVLGIDKAIISRAKRSLVTRRLLEEHGVDDDSRKRLLMLTAKGQALYTHWMPRARERQRAMLDSLDEDERELFSRIVDKLREHFT